MAEGRNGESIAQNRDCPTCGTAGILPPRPDLADFELKQIAAAPGVGYSISAVSRLFTQNPKERRQFARLRKLKAISTFLGLTMDELYEILTR